MSFSGYSLAKTKFNDPKKVLKEEFWGKLFANGGTTFFCKKTFKKKSVLITESHIYSPSWVRDHLDCGTIRSCQRKNESYRQIMSDLHNIVPATASFELNRRAAKFEELDDSVDRDDCQLRRVFSVIEPPDEIKGDIARIIFYMHHTYDLPIYGDLNQMIRWHRIDPPSKQELERNEEIKALQGNENFLVTNPQKIDEII